MGAVVSKKFQFFLRQLAKSMLQNILLPLIYDISCLFHPQPDPELVIFADAHHSELPFSMQVMYSSVIRTGRKISLHLHDYSHSGACQSLLWSIAFMWNYPRAGIVFICDYFLPASSCRKRSSTKLIQLWHSCGLIKKIGYAASDDIPKGYIGNPYRNYDLFTVSSPAVVQPLTQSLHLPAGVVHATGVSRTDLYFDNEWLHSCREHFYAAYPEAKEKKIVLWAPTFRGNASSPNIPGVEAFEQLSSQLGDDWFVLLRAHPHVDAYRVAQGFPPISNCSIPTEELLPITDLLVSDYSSVLCEYMFFRRPYVLYVPDLSEYEEKRGFYIDYHSLGEHIVMTPEALPGEIINAYHDSLSPEFAENAESRFRFHNGACDGGVSRRILTYFE